MGPPGTRNRAECATTCSLHDARPCGGYDTMAVYRLHGEGLPLSAPNVSTHALSRPEGDALADAGKPSVDADQQGWRGGHVKAHPGARAKRVGGGVGKGSGRRGG